ncbi:hypothetical protein ACNKHK_11500 [Shigella flexneri]
MCQPIHQAVAEHAIGMMMTLNRRIHRAYERTRDANFSLEGLTRLDHDWQNGWWDPVPGVSGIAALRMLKRFVRACWRLIPTQALLRWS